MRRFAGWHQQRPLSLRKRRSKPRNRSSNRPRITQIDTDQYRCGIDETWIMFTRRVRSYPVLNLCYPCSSVESVVTTAISRVKRGHARHGRRLHEDLLDSASGNRLPAKRCVCPEQQVYPGFRSWSHYAAQLVDSSTDRARRSGPQGFCRRGSDARGLIGQRQPELLEQDLDVGLCAAERPRPGRPLIYHAKIPRS